MELCMFYFLLVIYLYNQLFLLMWSALMNIPFKAKARIWMMYYIHYNPASLPPLPNLTVLPNAVVFTSLLYLVYCVIATRCTLKK